MPVNITDIQTELLKLLADPNTDARLGGGRNYLSERVSSLFPESERPTQQQKMEAEWSLVAQGLVYIDLSESSPENWRLVLTESGKEAACDEGFNPNNPGVYIEKLRGNVPTASDMVLQYANESLISYNNRCYLASAVMLGVASEAAFLEMAKAFGNWLNSESKLKFLQIVNNPRSNYVSKFQEFRKRIEPHKSILPVELSDGMSLALDSILDVLRICRNDAGHPTGKQISRDDAFINLQMFARYLQKMYALKIYFESN